MDEPRSVPRHENILTGSYYCLDCPINPFFTAAQAKTHWKQAHGDALDPNQRDAEEGVDYARGSQLLWMQQRRDKWLEAAVGEFGEELSLLIGADDISNEILIQGPCADA